MKKILLLIFLVVSLGANSQQTVVYGTVTDASTNEYMPFVRVQFQNSKIGTLTDSVGFYRIQTYYATDSLEFMSAGMKSQTVKVKLDKEQEINIKLSETINEFEEVVILPPDEFPSTILHKKVIAHKDINNKEKLSAYEYEVYSKVQADLNNLGEDFDDSKLVKKLDVLLDYMDSTKEGNRFLPLILSETLSNFYFKKNPKQKKEVITATKITGVENLTINQLLGDMYLDINVYDNSINLISRAFISPVADIARTYYKFYLDDSTFIDNQWCYKLRFVPKRTGDATFEGEMWIHDTTYAIRKISGNISPDVNINYVKDLYFEQEFKMIQPEVWMLVSEKMIADLKITKESKIMGVYARKYASRKYFAINSGHPDKFYRSDYTVELLDSAKLRDENYWIAHRHIPLNKQEEGIEEMVDSLENNRTFKTLKNLTYFATTGYWMLGKVELGSAYSLVSYNAVEKFRMALALRTSNNFSHRLEIGGKVAYGFGDNRFKYGGTIRYNITPKKRGMLSGYYNYDIEQIGSAPNAAAVGSTFGTLLRTGRLDKLTMVQKAGINLEKDIKKDVILYGGFEWKEYIPLGITPYVISNAQGGFDSINRITASEFTFRYRWTKDEEFVGGIFDRSSLRSKFPIISIQGIFGVKGLLGANYSYQKFELHVEHNKLIGPLGRIKYGATMGYVFGKAAYPFLKVHTGNESYWLQLIGFNKMNYFEFVSDKYIEGFMENHWEGAFFDRIPGVKKLKWRFVTAARVAYGHISQRNISQMELPSFTKQFGKIPYVEAAIGIENIFNIGRVDLVYRITHNEPNSKFINHLAIRARFSFLF
ncbi:MAG: DUF5686 family protein [Bacteroidota bacterium]